VQIGGGSWTLSATGIRLVKVRELPQQYGKFGVTTWRHSAASSISGIGNTLAVVLIAALVISYRVITASEIED
jgi:hypothetical protein